MITLRPYQEQLSTEGAEILTYYHILYLGMQVRTGKTLTALVTAEKHGAKSVLMLTKKKAVPSINGDYSMLSPSYKFHITNYEQASKLKAEDYDLIIIDEGQNLGTFPKPSKRIIEIRNLCKGKDIIICSGTPSPESYSQLFHQMMLSSWSPFNRYLDPRYGFTYAFHRWAKDFVNVKTKRVAGGREVKDFSDCDGNKVWAEIKHLFLQLSQEDAGFKATEVPEEFHYVEMLNNTMMFYKTLEKDQIIKRVIEHMPGEQAATAENGADLINKLAQISSGTLIFDDEPKGTILDVSKALFIKSYFTDKKIAIFYRFKAEGELLKAFFPSWTESPEEFNANPSSTFIGQVQASREGVNLSTADCLVGYNIDFSATSYFQFKARGQTKDRETPCPLHWIFSKGGIEDRIYQAVSNKTNFTYSYYRKHAKSPAGKLHPKQDHQGNETPRIPSPQSHHQFNQRLGGR